jgi:hypothetical protein
LRDTRPQLRVAISPEYYWFIQYVPPFWWAWKLQSLGEVRSDDRWAMWEEDLSSLLERIQDLRSKGSDID